MAVRLGDGTRIVVTAGEVSDGVPMKADTRFRIWSISKTFTTVALLQLVDEGKVRLEDTLAHWFPDVPNSEKITLRHLISHTSGIRDYITADPLMQAGWAYQWTPEELIQVGAVRSPLFEPGERYDYSNTNFVLAARIIEKVTGQTLAQRLRSRIFDPLGMKDTFEMRDEDIPGGYSRGFDVISGFDRKYVDVTDRVHPTAVWGTGSIVSSAEDLCTWLAAVVEGSLVSPKLKDELMRPYKLNDGTPIDRGLDLSVVKTQWGTLLGHGGGPMPGYTGTVIYLKEKRIIKALLINGTSMDAPGIIGRAGWPVLVP